MIGADQSQKLADAFERIEGTILPCIAMMLETLMDASRDLIMLLPHDVRCQSAGG